MSNFKPNTKEELLTLIDQEMKINGHQCSLNHIDISLIEDMSYLFSSLYFNGDISRWNTSNVKTMRFMFHRSSFNGDISKWDVSNVVDMNSMFHSSKFNSDISGWDVSSVIDMSFMFFKSRFKQDLSKWKPLSLKKTGKLLMFDNKNYKTPYWYEVMDANNAIKEFLIKESFDKMNSEVNEKVDKKKKNKI